VLDGYWVVDVPDVEAGVDGVSKSDFMNILTRLKMGE
jgi:hypothetical protein